MIGNYWNLSAGAEGCLYVYIIASSDLVALVDQIQPMAECTKVYYAYIWGHENIPRQINSARSARWLVYRGNLPFAFVEAVGGSSRGQARGST